MPRHNTRRQLFLTTRVHTGCNGEQIVPNYPGPHGPAGQQTRHVVYIRWQTAPSVFLPRWHADLPLVLDPHREKKTKLGCLPLIFVSGEQRVERRVVVSHLVRRVSSSAASGWGGREGRCGG